MDDIETLLRGTSPRKPSPQFVARGLARIATAATRRDVRPAGWSVATVALTVLLAASMLLNVVLWQRIGGISLSTTDNEGEPAGYIERSLFHAVNGVLVRETQYRLVDPSENGE
jgi:hypothetical protein